MNWKLTAGIGGGFALAFAFGAFSVWVFQKGAAYDARGVSVTMKGKMMEQKAHTLEGLVSAMARGDFSRARWLVSGLEQSMLTIEGYLDTDMYAAHGRSYRDATLQLREALDAKDWPGAKDATLAVERSCLDCHQLVLGH